MRLRRAELKSAPAAEKSSCRALSIASYRAIYNNMDRDRTRRFGGESFHRDEDRRSVPTLWKDLEPKRWAEGGFSLHGAGPLNRVATGAMLGVFRDTAGGA